MVLERKYREIDENRVRGIVLKLNPEYLNLLKYSNGKPAYVYLYFPEDRRDLCLAERGERIDGRQYSLNYTWAFSAQDLFWLTNNGELSHKRISGKPHGDDDKCQRIYVNDSDKTLCMDIVDRHGNGFTSFSISDLKKGYPFKK